MYFDGQHTCKSPQPFDATTFDLRSSISKQTFSGVLKLTVSSKQVSGSAEAPVKYRKIEETCVTIAVEIDNNQLPIIKPIVSLPASETQVYQSMGVLV